MKTKAADQKVPVLAFVRWFVVLVFVFVLGFVGPERSLLSVSVGGRGFCFLLVGGRGFDFLSVGSRGFGFLSDS